MRRRLPAIVTFAAALVASAPSRAEACSNAVRDADDIVSSCHEAERLLDDGDPGEARTRAAKLVSTLNGMRMAYGDAGVTEPGLRARASRVVALADLRLDPGGRRDSKRKAVLEEALKVLEGLAEENPKDSAKQTDLGEALASVRPAEGKELLEDLDARDIVTTPYAYVALARLRGAAHDVKGRDAALGRCRTMAKTPSICQLDPTPLKVAGVLPPAAFAAMLAALGVAARRARGRRAG
jgi:hypothetical protein